MTFTPMRVNTMVRAFDDNEIAERIWGFGCEAQMAQRPAADEHRSLIDAIKMEVDIPYKSIQTKFSNTDQDPLLKFALTGNERHTKLAASDLMRKRENRPRAQKKITASITSTKIFTTTISSRRNDCSITICIKI